MEQTFSPILHSDPDPPTDPLYFNLGKPLADFLQLVDLADEEIAIPLGNLCVRNVDHVLVDVKVNLRPK